MTLTLEMDGAHHSQGNPNLALVAQSTTQLTSKLAHTTAISSSFEAGFYAELAKYLTELIRVKAPSTIVTLSQVMENGINEHHQPTASTSEIIAVVDLEQPANPRGSDTADNLSKALCISLDGTVLYALTTAKFDQKRPSKSAG